MFPEVFRLQKPDIHTEAGQRQTRRTLQAMQNGIKAQRRQFKKEKLTPEQLKRVMGPMKCFYLDILNQVQTYERAKKGIIYPQTTLECIGHPLIMGRIARRWSRKALAKKLDVPESEVVQWEQNEYHGVPMDTIRRVSAILRVEFDIKVRLLKNGQESSEFYSTIYNRTAPPVVKPPSKKP